MFAKKNKARRAETPTAGNVPSSQPNKDFDLFTTISRISEAETLLSKTRAEGTVLPGKDSKTVFRDTQFCLCLDETMNLELLTNPSLFHPDTLWQRLDEAFLPVTEVELVEISEVTEEANNPGTKSESTFRRLRLHLDPATVEHSRFSSQALSCIFPPASAHKLQNVFPWFECYIEVQAGVNDSNIDKTSTEAQGGSTVTCTGSLDDSLNAFLNHIPLLAVCRSRVDGKTGRIRSLDPELPVEILDSDSGDVKTGPTTLTQDQDNFKSTAAPRESVSRSRRLQRLDSDDDIELPSTTIADADLDLELSNTVPSVCCHSTLFVYLGTSLQPLSLRTQSPRSPADKIQNALPSPKKDPRALHPLLPPFLDQEQLISEISALLQPRRDDRLIRRKNRRNRNLAPEYDPVTALFGKTTAKPNGDIDVIVKGEIHNPNSHLYRTNFSQPQLAKIKSVFQNPPAIVAGWKEFDHKEFDKWLSNARDKKDSEAATKVQDETENLKLSGVKQVEQEKMTVEPQSGTSVKSPNGRRPGKR